MLRHVTTTTHKNNLVLSNIDPGAGGTSTKKVKIGNLPNIFDDDCSLILKKRVFGTRRWPIKKPKTLLMSPVPAWNVEKQKKG